MSLLITKPENRTRKRKKSNNNQSKTNITFPVLEIQKKKNCDDDRKK